MKIAGDARVHAQDDTSFTDFTGTIAIGGDAGVGIGVDVGLIGKHTQAAIGQAAQVNAANLSLEADSSETIQSVSAGVAAGVYVGAAGALGVYSVTTDTSATIGQHAQVNASRNVAVLAADQTLTDFFIGGVGISGVVGLGASVGVALVNATTTALIDQNASVSAQGNGAGASYIDGYDVSFAPNSASDLITAPNPDGQIGAASGADVAPESAAAAKDAAARLILDKRTATPSMRTANGVVVDATDQTRVRSLTIAAGVGSVGISMSGNVPVVTTTTTATIADGARINSPGTPGAAAGQSAVVNAATDFYQIGVAGSAGGGAVGAGAGAQVSVIKPTTTASIGQKARVYTAGDTLVTATAREDFLAAAAAAAAGGSASLAGGVAVVALNSATTADIGQNATVVAGGNVAVTADDQTRTAMIAGSVSLSGGVGVGGSVGVTTISKDTEAYIDNGASIVALGNSGSLSAYSGAGAGAFDTAAPMTGLLVQANSNESVFTLAFAGSAGFTAGVAGAVTVPEIMATTKATVGTGVTINLDNTGAAATQDVNVTARDSSTIVSIDGSLGAGVFGGVAGSIDVGTIQNDTIASIGDGTRITVRRDARVNALANKVIDSTAVSAAGSAGIAIAAGVSVYSVGNGLGSDGSSQLQTPGAGSPSVNSYADSQASNNQTDGIVQQSPNADVKGTSTKAQSARGGVQTSAALTPGTLTHGTSATIGDAQITTGGTLAVQGTDRLHGTLLDGAAAVGAGAVGAGIGVLTVTPVRHRRHLQHADAERRRPHGAGDDRPYARRHLGGRRARPGQRPGLRRPTDRSHHDAGLPVRRPGDHVRRGDGGGGGHAGPERPCRWRRGFLCGRGGRGDRDRRYRRDQRRAHRRRRDDRQRVAAGVLGQYRQLRCRYRHRLHARGARRHRRRLHRIGGHGHGIDGDGCLHGRRRDRRDRQCGDQGERERLGQRQRLGHRGGRWAGGRGV